MKSVQFILITIILFSMAVTPAIYAQKLIQDTLVVSFTSLPDSLIDNFVLDTVIDARAESGRTLGLYEVSKYWIIPVDLLILADRSLAKSIKNIFPAEKSDHRLRLQIRIDKFTLLKNTNSLLYPHYKINSAITIFRINTNQQPAYIGQFLYESTCRQKLWGDKLKAGFETVLHSWALDFAHDITCLVADLRPAVKPYFTDLRSERPEVKWINFYSGFDYIYGLRERLWDGEIIFSDREPRHRFYRNGYGLRYRVGKQFESIEYASSVDYLLFRLSPNFIFSLKSQILLGVNRWKDYRKKEHKIYDAFIGDVSFSQRLVFNPLDKASLLAGIGLGEDLYYIYSHGFKFQVGLLIHLGLKL